MTIWLVALIVAVASYFGVAAVQQWARQRGILDVPNRRSSHSVPTPTGGGVVFLPLTVLATTVIASVVEVSWFSAAWYFGLAGMVAAVSWFDDLRPLAARARLGVHFLAAIAAAVALGGWPVLVIPVMGILAVGPVGGIVLATVWIMGFTNAYNFMDGIDGIAGMQAVVGGLAWAVLAGIGGWHFAGALGAVLAAAAAGFLLHNWPPARIFMGDVGSAYFGFTFAMLPLLADPADPLLPVAACLIVWPFITDSAHTFLRRLAAGENVLSPHRSHLYQRLVRAGWTHRDVTTLYAALAAIGAGLAWAWWLTEAALHALYIIVVAVLHAVLVVAVRRAEARKPEPERASWDGTVGLTIEDRSGS